MIYIYINNTYLYVFHGEGVEVLIIYYLPQVIRFVKIIIVHAPLTFAYERHCIYSTLQILHKYGLRKSKKIVFNPTWCGMCKCIVVYYYYGYYYNTNTKQIIHIINELSTPGVTYAKNLLFFFI